MLKKLPQEIATWYIIPTIRREFVKELIKRGMTQRQAAAKLGLTEAAVSNYMKDRRASEVQLNNNILKLIKASVDKIINDSDVFTELYRIVSECEKDLTVCKIHMIYDEVPEGCNTCFETNKTLIQIKEKI